MDGAEIRRLRRRAGLTQEALAERIGVEQGTISRWERGVERPRPKSEQSLRDLLLVDLEEMAKLRQLALIRSDLVAGGLLDAQTRLKEISKSCAEYYRRRKNLDIREDCGKPLEQQLIEKGGHPTWSTVQKSGILSGRTLLLRMFFSAKHFSHLTHYEPVFEDGQFAGILAYIARSVPTGVDTDPPGPCYADAVYMYDPGQVEVVHRSAGAETAKRLLSGNPVW